MNRSWWEQHEVIQSLLKKFSAPEIAELAGVDSYTLKTWFSMTELAPEDKFNTLKLIQAVLAA